VNLLLGLHGPIIYQYWHEWAERWRSNARRYEQEVRRMLNPRHPTKLPRIKEGVARAYPNPAHGSFSEPCSSVSGG
jgi:hypothetical protein